MDTKILHTLEYRKILNTLQSYAQTTMGKKKAEQLEPISELEEVKRLLQQTDEAFTFDRLKGSPSFGGIVDITASVKRAEIGGTLNPHELLGISNTTLAARRLKRQIAALHEDEKIESLFFISDQLSEQKLWKTRFASVLMTMQKWRIAPV